MPMFQSTECDPITVPTKRADPVSSQQRPLDALRKIGLKATGVRLDSVPIRFEDTEDV
jgi:hypothetical protein